jgi:hypothetical protein
MPGLPWTKFQDFYLRLGFLKVLVAVLDPDRRSAANAPLRRKIEIPLLMPAKDYPALADAVAQIDWYEHEKVAKGWPLVAEALLIHGDYPSWLFAINSRDTSYKVLDWGHDVELIGRGNQISERGLLLRRLASPGAEGFLGGDPARWNPFHLSTVERLFFLFHLFEIDRVTVILTRLVAGMPEGEALESSAAGRLTCAAMFEMLADAQDGLLPIHIPQYRVTLELARTIAEELGMREFLPESPLPIARRKLPKKVMLPGMASNPTQRKAPKNSDHQTIPRFEQLLDLGLVYKPSFPDGRPAKRKWRYAPTKAARIWSSKAPRKMDRKWMWSHFAGTCSEAGLFPSSRASPTFADVIEVFSTAYEDVKRPIGHTPFESVALRAMLEAASRGMVMEMETFHTLMFSVKKRGALPDHAFFAAGVGVDDMFIHLRKGYREKLLQLDSSEYLR